FTKINIAQPYDISKNVLSTDGAGANDMSNSLALGDTYLFSSNVVNSFRVFGNRVGATTPGAQTFGPQQVGIHNFYDYYGNFIPFFLFAGIFGSPMVDFLTGNAAQFHQANPNPENLTQNFVGLYASDTWKISH